MMHNFLSVIEFLEVILINMIGILAMSAKLTTPGFFKRRYFEI